MIASIKKKARISQAVLAVICSLILSEAVGQSDSSGVFMSVADYEGKRLTLPVSCKSMKHSITLPRFVKKNVTIRFEGKKYRYSKASIFGYQNCEKKTYRFFLDEAYEIINTDGFWLYRQIIEGNWDDFRTYTIYYFSKDPYSIIYPLTKHDLKWIFKERLRFVETLDSSFKSEYDLSSFDTSRKKYKVIEAFWKE